jgi:hypothetical protein
MHQRYKDAIKPYEFIDRALETEDDKEIDRFLSQGRAMMNLVNDPETQDWYIFFDQAYTSLEPEFTDTEPGDDIRDLGLNLAASDPLTMFDHTKFDGKGNLYPSRLSYAWIGATALLGSLHLFFDVQLQRNRLAAQTFEDMNEDDEDYVVPADGAPKQPWIELPNSEK